MIREQLFGKRLGADRRFRWRGGEISRIEGFSDGVFSITITLLIVSSSTTNTFFDIWQMVSNLPAFLVSFVFVMYAWFEHYRFFHRYGLEDMITVCLNALLMFLVLVLAFPLKFLATFLWYLILGRNTDSLFVLPEHIGSFLSEFEQRTYCHPGDRQDRAGPEAVSRPDERRDSGSLAHRAWVGWAGWQT